MTVTNEDHSVIQHYIDLYKLNEILDVNIARELTLFHFPARSYVVKSGDPVENLYFFVAGKAKVSITMENGHSLLIRFYQPLELVGDVEFACQNHHICDMRAIEDVTCLGLSIETVKRFSETNSRLLMFICQSLGRKLVSFNMTSAVNQTYPVENKLASYLVAVSDQNGLVMDKVREIQSDNLTELAELLGTSYRQLTRVIRKFKDRGWIKRVNNTFEILDMKQLILLSRDIY